MKKISILAAALVMFVIGSFTAVSAFDSHNKATAKASCCDGSACCAAGAACCE